MQTLRSAILLLTTAIIWGVAFVAQSMGMEYVGPFTFICVRSFLGGLVLIPFVFLYHKGEEPVRASLRQPSLWLGGLACGLVLCLGCCFQQYAILFTTVGKAGFIASCSIIIVPLLGLFVGRRCGLNVWMGVAVAMVGFYFLCINETMYLRLGDSLAFVSTTLFAIHILVIDAAVRRVDNAVLLSCIMFFVCGVLSSGLMFLCEKPEIAPLLAAWKPVLYAGVLSSGVGFTLQMIGQKNIHPSVASLILSLQSVAAMLAGAALLNQQPTGREVFGCVLVLVAIVVAQVPLNFLQRNFH